MRTLSRYILREHVSPFFSSLTLIVFLFVLNFAFQILGKILGKGIELRVILEFFLYNIAWILAMAVPMAALIATLMAFGRLAGDHEITALKASGVGLPRLVRPVLIAGTLLMVALIAYNNWVLPEFNYRSSLLRRSIMRKQPTMQMEESLFLFDVPDYVIHSRHVNHETRRMSGVTIFDESDSKMQTTILADSADLLFEEQHARFNLHLYDGQIHRNTWKDPDSYSMIDFESCDLYIEARGMVLQRQTSKYRGDREQTIAQMLERIQEWHERDPVRNERRIRSYWVEIHKKLSLPVAILVFILIGAPLGIKSGSGGIGMSGGLSVAFFLIYWIFLIGGEDLADRGFVPPWVAMWTPNMLLGLAGIYLMRSVGREGTPLQLPHWIRHLFRKRGVIQEDSQNQAEMKAMSRLAAELEEASSDEEPRA